MSRQTADNMVHVANVYGAKLPSISNLAPTALYALAAPSTPPEVREQVEERAVAGERVTVARFLISTVPPAQPAAVRGSR